MIGGQPYLSRERGARPPGRVRRARAFPIFIARVSGVPAGDGFLSPERKRVGLPIPGAAIPRPDFSSWRRI